MNRSVYGEVLYDNLGNPVGVLPIIAAAAAPLITKVIGGLFKARPKPAPPPQPPPPRPVAPPVAPPVVAQPMVAPPVPPVMVPHPIMHFGPAFSPMAPRYAMPMPGMYPRFPLLRRPVRIRVRRG